MQISQNLALFTAIKTAIKNHKFFTLFIVAYCAVLVAFSRYAPNLDDLGYFAFIYQNRIDFFTEYGGGNPADGRFNAFAFLDLLLLMQISKSPYLFFGANAMLFTIFSALYLKILNLSLGKSALNALITALLSISVGFVIAFFGICYLEKIQIVWIAIFMLCTFFVLQKPTNTNQLLGIIALNIALYYKEPTFIAAFVFGTILLLYARQNSRKDLQKYAFGVICSSLLYALLYVVLVLSWSVREYYSQNIMTMSDFVECIISDSLIVFGVGGVVLYRIYCVIFKREKIEPFFDGFLVASFTYFIAFMCLKMYASYYLLPCYVFGIPSVLYFSRKYWKNIFIKICIILGLFGFLAQNLPSGIHKMIDLKAQGVQFHKTLDFVASHLKENNDAKIFFEGIGGDLRIYGGEALFYASWFNSYLHIMYGAEYNANRLRTEAECYYDLYFCLRQGTPKSGDLIIANNKSAFGDALQRAQNRGDLLYKSGFPTIPKIALIPLLRYLFAESTARKVAESTPKNTNYFALPLETYVFKIR